MATKHTPTLAERLIAVRGANHHTLRQAGEAIGASHSIVAKWEAAESIPVNRFLAGLAAYLGITMEQMIELRDAAAHAPVRITAMNRRARGR